MKTLNFLILVFLAAILLDLFYWVVIRKRGHQIRNEVRGIFRKGVHVKFQHTSPPAPRLPLRKFNWKNLLTVLEILLILGFTLWVGRAYLKFDENTWPSGYEFGTAVRTNYYWVKFKECGLCFLWDGSIKGGAPALVDLHGSWLHPLAAIPTLVAGFVNGTKLMLLGALFLAGLAQWWMAKLFGTGLVPRLFTAAMAVVAGNLAATMDIGTTGIFLSHASACLALAGGIRFARNPGRRNAVVWGILLALLVVSGQTYLQAGFFLALFPALLILFTRTQWKSKQIYLNLLLACGLMVLLSGIFIIPLAHFLPQIGKWAAPDFEFAQSIQYIPLNLVINDYEFYQNGMLGKLPYIGFYSVYIGWLPVLLAFAAIGFRRKENSRLILFFGVAITLVLLASSGLTFKFLTLFTDMAYFFRFPCLISGFLVPLTLGLAAIGLDGLLKLGIFQHKIPLPSKLRNKSFNINFFLLVMLVPMFFSIRSAYLYGQRWYTTVKILDQSPSIYDQLKFDRTEWVSISQASHGWVIPLLENDIKLTESFRTWWWIDREDPPAYFIVNEDQSVTVNSENEYAMLFSRGDKIPCAAHANGGYIQVHCESKFGGVLQVTEHYWPGWKVWIDGERVQLIENQNWLVLEIKPGSHNLVFRYLPLDVLIGFLLTCTGIILAVWIYFKK